MHCNGLGSAALCGRAFSFFTSTGKLQSYAKERCMPKDTIPRLVLPLIIRYRAVHYGSEKSQQRGATGWYIDMWL